MPEGKVDVEIHGSVNKEQLNQNLVYAREVVFGGVMRDTEEPDYRQFDPFVKYETGGDEKQIQFADLAVKDLFKAGAELEKTETQEKLIKAKPFSEEARALEKPGPREIAYDYVLGNRVAEESAEITAGVLKGYVEDANNERYDFTEMKRRHFEKSEPTRKEWNELNMYATGAGDHVRRAVVFMKNQYRIPEKEEEGLRKIAKLELRRHNPLHAQQLANL